MKSDFTYALGFDVLIKRNGLTGTVRMASLDRYDHERFYVEYSDNAGAIQGDWFEVDQLEGICTEARPLNCDFCGGTYPSSSLANVLMLACPKCVEKDVTPARVPGGAA